MGKSKNKSKMKTHRAAAKRFKVTGSGKLMRRQGFRAHLLRKKPSSRTRRLAREVEVPASQRRHVKRQLGL